MELSAGNVVLGPAGREVHVDRVVRHPKAERDIVRLRLEGAGCRFEVTADHFIEVAGPDGTKAVVQASSLLASDGRRKCIFDGRSYRALHYVERFTETTDVVEVVFADNATVIVDVARAPTS